MKLFAIILLFPLVCFSQPKLLVAEGQSNTLGNEAIASVPSDLKPTVPGAYIFATRNSTWETLDNWNNQGYANYAYGNVDTGIHTFGYELRLMKLMVAQYGAGQRLVKYALGGTSLAANSSQSAYQSQTWHPTDGPLYTGSNSNYTAAQAALSSPIAPTAYIWGQGEQDALNSGSASAYQSNLTNLLSAKRTFYGNSSLPVIILRMSANQTGYAYKSTVQAAQDYAAANIANTYIVNTDDLPIQGDGSHYTGVGYDSLANRIFRIISYLSSGGSLPLPVKFIRVKIVKLNVALLALLAVGLLFSSCRKEDLAAVNTEKIKVEWEAESDGATYTVEASTNGKDFFPLASSTKDKDTLSFTVAKGLVYRVKGTEKDEIYYTQIIKP